MIFFITLMAALVAFLSPSVHGAETDVVRIFDDKMKLTEKEMMALLKEADLEKHGFTRTEEVSTETDEDGNVIKRRTLYYRVTDDCDKAMIWELVLEQRLPKKLKNFHLLLTTVKEIESRISARKTKSCTVGLEIHPNRCGRKSTRSGRGKRLSARSCFLCLICWNSAIAYDEE